MGKNVFAVVALNPYDEHVKDFDADKVKEVAKKLEYIRKDTGVPVRLNIGRNRFIAIFDKFKKAEKYVINNTNDLYELGFYPWVVIETVELNDYPISLSRVFYKLKDDNLFEKVEEEPEWAKRIINFAVG